MDLPLQLFSLRPTFLGTDDKATSHTDNMADDDEQIAIYDEVEIEDMTFDETTQLYHYPCPCGDRFEIALVDLMDEADIAVCPSCSLMIRVIFEVVSLRWCCRPLRGVVDWTIC